MTREERNTKLKHFITCLKCEVSGKECDDNCSVQYEAGNMGEIIENLEAISKALEPEPRKGHWILGGYDNNYYICDKCNYKASEYYFKSRYNFCPNCGADMREVEK